MSEKVAPFRLKPMMVERVWGSRDLAPWYPVQSEKAIGEAWLSGDDCVVDAGPLEGKTLIDAQGYFPLLVKMLFPKEKLSVQVHPDDADAERLGGGAQAKTECWYLLEAEPGATVAVGLKDGTSKDDVQRAIGDGTLEELLEHVPVAAGDMVYVSAGTMHAIGPGVVILEIQQNSDTTYRLYDYGRPRELHLERGLNVLKMKTDAGKVASKAIDGGTQLIAVPHFTVERYTLEAEPRVFASMGAECIVALSGDGVIRSALGEVALAAGQAVIVPASVRSYEASGTAELVRCYC